LLSTFIVDPSTLGIPGRDFVRSDPPSFSEFALEGEGMSNGERSDAGGHTNAIITALASVLAAVIAASGGIIVATIHAKHEAQDESVKLRRQVVDRSAETESLRATVSSLEERLRKGGQPFHQPKIAKRKTVSSSHDRTAIVLDWW
jgi:hypothetical protein